MSVRQNVVESTREFGSEPHRATSNSYLHLSTDFDIQNQVAWGYMHAEPRPCFTETLLEELMTWFDILRRQIRDPAQTDPLYYVVASGIPGVYNLGGDLNLFHELIVARDRERLHKYAKACIEPLYANQIHLSMPGLKSISLVQGDALGGGFECALSSNVVIAERGCKMGFPEILFNLFPGMGAYTLLSRRIGSKQAEKMIMSGNLYTSDTLYEMGVVDVLAEPKRGHEAVMDYIRKEKRARNGILSFRRAVEAVDPVSYEELMAVTEIWVDAALNIGQKDLRMMEVLVSRQRVKVASMPS